MTETLVKDNTSTYFSANGSSERISTDLESYVHAEGRADQVKQVRAKIDELLIRH